MATNAFGTVAGQIVQLATIPAQLSLLGPAQFGLVVLFNSFVAAGSLTDAGIGPTVLRFVARFAHSQRRLQHLFASALTVVSLLCVAVLIGALGVGWGYSHYGSAASLAGAVPPLAMGAAVAAGMAASMLCNIGFNVLRGLRQYRAFALAETANRVLLPLLGTLAAVVWRDALYVLITCTVFMWLFAVTLLRFTARRAFITLKLTTRLRYFRRRMLHFSKWVWVQAVFGYFGGQADRLIVAGLMSLSALSVYSLATTIANAGLGILTAGASFLLPEAASRLSDKIWLKNTYVSFTLLFSAVSATLITALTLISPVAVRYWVGPTMGEAALPILFPLLWTISSTAASIPGTLLLNAMGHAQFVATLGMLSNGFMLASMLVGGSLYGINGIVGARLLSLGTGFAIRALTSHKIFKMPHPILMALQMLWPTLTGSAIVLPLSLWFLT